MRSNVGLCTIETLPNARRALITDAVSAGENSRLLPSSGSSINLMTLSCNMQMVNRPTKLNPAKSKQVGTLLQSPNPNRRISYTGHQRLAREHSHSEPNFLPPSRPRGWDHLLYDNLPSEDCVCGPMPSLSAPRTALLPGGVLPLRQGRAHRVHSQIYLPPAPLSEPSWL